MASRRLIMAKRLASGRWVDGALWYALSVLRQQVKLRVRAADREVTIRTATPDLDVAFSCFSGEFDEVLGARPALKHPLIVDAGGYIGTAAIVFAEAYPDATIVTLEPSSENFAVLKRNTAPYPNIVPMQRALSPNPGRLPLNNRGTGQWGFTLVSSPADAAASAMEEVECITLQEIMQMYGATGIGILKLDIEGGEHALFTSDMGWLDKTDALCIELHDRIVPGCSELYEQVTQGRRNSRMHGEKYLSLAS